MKKTKSIFKVIIILVLFLSAGLVKDVQAAGTATVSWNANTESDLAGYKIYYGTSSRTSSCPPGGYTNNIDVGNVTSYTFSNLTEGATYYFSVTAYDTSGNESCFSSQVSKVIPAAGTTPPVRNNGSPTGTLSTGTTSATLSLTTDENATCKHSTTPGIPYSEMTNIFSTSGGTSHSTILTGLANGTTYNYYIRCQDTAGNTNTDDYTVVFSVDIDETPTPTPTPTPSPPPDVTLPYPDGSLLRAQDDPKVYVIVNNQRCWIPDSATFLAKGYDWLNIVVVELSLLEQYDQGPDVSSVVPFSVLDAVLLRAEGDVKVYQIISGKKLWIPTAQTFNSLGLSWQNITISSPTEIAGHQRLKLAKTLLSADVYYLTEAGQKRHISSPEVFVSYGNKWEDIVELDQSYLDIYPDSELIRLEQGTKVYLLQNGIKRWIKTAAVFNQRGYDWTKIAPVNQTELDSYQEGGEIE